MKDMMWFVLLKQDIPVQMTSKYWRRLSLKIESLITLDEHFGDWVVLSVETTSGCHKGKG